MAYLNSAFGRNPTLNSVNPGLRYQTVRGAGAGVVIPYGLITGSKSEVFTKYTSGSGVGAQNIFSRRSKLKKAMSCHSNCARFIYPLDQPNTNVNGRISYIIGKNYFLSNKYDENLRTSKRI
jgi:hypothetical protein